jgi:phage gpG-like protein
VTVTVDDSRLKAALTKLSRQLDDPGETLDDIGQRLADQIRARLGAGIQYDGVPMKPLKVRVGVPLNDTRTHIYKRINSQLIGKTSVAVGLLDGDENIAKVHQFGSSKKGIPARPYLPIDPAGNVDLPREWADDVLNAIESGLRGALR